MQKKLSILTCTLHDRFNKFKLLQQHLTQQIRFKHDIELLANVDSGEKPIGQKRNELLCAAKGEYVVFIDDDDWVSNDYISVILTAIKDKKPDCCGIEGIIFFKNRYKQKFIHSIQYDKWYHENGTYYRCPNHLNPIKREYALATGFQNISKGEDSDFSLRIKPMLKTEVLIKKPIYYYKPSK